MQIVRLACVAMMVAVSFSGTGALAFSVDDANSSKNGAANFGDPDDKIPFPHVADDGSQPSNHFQAQPVGNSGMSFGIAPSQQPGADAAFQRAQQRMQQ